VIRRIEANVANSDDDHPEFQNSQANPRGNVTIFDVAEKAGVSFVSVSRVFNGHANVSDKMRKRVLEAARAVGYQPRTSVRAGIIAVLVQEEYDKNLQLDKYQLCGHLFFAAANQGYFIEVVPVRRIQMLTQHLVNGVIELDCSSERLYAFQELNKIPVILTQRATHQPRWGSVSIDYVFEARIALQQLLDLGHKKITVFVDRPRHTANQQRLEGMQVLLEQRGLPPDTLEVLELQEPHLLATCKAVLAGPSTGLLNFHQDLLMPLLDTLFNRLQCRIPEDLSLITLDNSGICANYSPRISCIRQPLADLAEQAVLDIIQMIADPSRRTNKKLKSIYESRNSCAAPSFKRSPAGDCVGEWRSR